MTNPQPQINYPTTWSYRLVGTSEPELRAAIQQILNQQNNNHNPSTLKPANTPSNLQKGLQLLT